jgi:hypothetical protein
MAANDTQRRSYGTGALFEKADSAGRVTWYGKWRHNGTRVKRRIGPKRVEGSKDGLTRRAAEAELRRLRGEVRPTVAPSETVTIAEVGRAYLAADPTRKKATRASIETALHAKRYADYAPRSRDAELVAAAFSRDDDLVGADCREGVASTHDH